MDNFDLRKYLSENKLLKENIAEGRMKDPSRSIKMGKYPQVSSDTPVPMNVKYLTTNGEKLTMKVQAKNRKEAVDAVKSKDPNFKAEIKTDFVYDKDGNKLVKENIQDEDLLASQAIDILDEFRVYAESEDLIQYLNQSMDYLERIPSNDDVYSAIQAVADGLNPYTGEEFDYEVDDMQSELERLIA